MHKSFTASPLSFLFNRFYKDRKHISTNSSTIKQTYSDNKIKEISFYSKQKSHFGKWSTLWDVNAFGSASTKFRRRIFAELFRWNISKHRWQGGVPVLSIRPRAKPTRKMMHVICSTFPGKYYSWLRIIAAIYHLSLLSVF